MTPSCSVRLIYFLVDLGMCHTDTLLRARSMGNDVVFGVSFVYFELIIMINTQPRRTRWDQDSN